MAHSSSDHNGLAPQGASPWIKVPFKLRYMGMGLYLAWIMCSSFGRDLVGIDAWGFFGSPFDDVPSCVINVACLLLIVIFARQLTPMIRRKSILLLTGIFAFLGTTLPLLSMVFSQAEYPLAFVGSTMVGAASAFLYIGWSEFYSTLPTHEVSVHYSASNVIAVVFYFAMLACGVWAGAILACLLPVASVALLWVNVNRMPDADEDITDKISSSWSFPAKPAVMMAAYVFAFFFFRSFVGGYPEVRWLGGAIVALVIFVMSYFFFRKFEVFILYKFALPLMVSGILLWVVLGDAALPITSLLTDSGHTAIRMFIIIVLCNICFRYGMSALILFGIVRIVTILAQGVGVFSGATLAAIYGGDSLMANLLIVTAVIMLVTVSMVFLSERNFYSTTWSIVPQKEDKPGFANQLPTVMSYYEAFVWRCSRVAKQYGLTYREEEVLTCLAKDKSISEIESELFISNNTAKTHIRHIYEKLNIHSREEAVKIVEGIT